jgi:glycosyltransferase involved in cell wall biosynthesis
MAEKITAIVPMYNAQHSIERAVESALSQDGVCLDVIVIDDGSSDGSVDVVARLGSPRVSVIRQPHSGVSAARNAGIQAARGHVIAFLDADDIWLPGHCCRLMSMVKSFPECGFYGLNYQRTDLDAGIPALVSKSANGPARRVHHYFAEYLAGTVRVFTSSLAARRDGLLGIRGFPLGVRLGEDILTWARLAVHLGLVYDPTVSAVYHRPAGIQFRKPPLPDGNDVVAEGLRTLRRLLPKEDATDLEELLHRWYTERAVNYLKLGLHEAAFREGEKAREMPGRRFRARLLLQLCSHPQGAHVLSRLMR